MRVAVVKETGKNERRVALVPDAVSKLVKSGLDVAVESGAGEGAWFENSAFEQAGATVLPAGEVFSGSDVFLKIQPPAERSDLGAHEADLIGPGSSVISFLQPVAHRELIARLADRKITAVSMNTIPRISRAQSMDALSSQASLAGYKAVILAAASLGKYFPMLTTAAGTLAPAKVLVLGAGVAGLQAIATARRLGAVVEANDVRPAVKEEVESLGARFIHVEEQAGQSGGSGAYATEQSEEQKLRQRELISEHVGQSDVVITTAQIPDRKAPLIVTREMVEAMNPGSVIIDLAAEGGGNCELTRPGEDVLHQGVLVCGPLNIPSTMPVHASQLYARNISTLLNLLVKEGRLHFDFDDEIVKGCVLAHDGRSFVEGAE